MKKDFNTIFRNDTIAAYYDKIRMHKVIPVVAMILLVWQIIKGNILFAIIILAAFLVSIIIFAFFITLYEEKNKIKEGGTVIVFPEKSPPDKIIICDMCEKLIDDSEEYCKISSDPHLILCPKCMLKHNDGKKND